jgi:hypothetical protein
MSLRATKYVIFLVDFAFSTALFPIMAPFYPEWMHWVGQRRLAYLLF